MTHETHVILYIFDIPPLRKAILILHIFSTISSPVALLEPFFKVITLDCLFFDTYKIVVVFGYIRHFDNPISNRLFVIITITTFSVEAQSELNNLKYSQNYLNITPNKFCLMEK